MKKFLTATCAFFAALVFLPVQSSAQYSTAGQASVLNYSLEYARAKGESTAAVRDGIRASINDSDNSGGVRAAKKVVRGATLFSSTGAYIFPKEFALKMGKTAKQRREMESGMVNGLDTFEVALKSQGYATNDVARSFSELFTMSLGTYYDVGVTQKQKDGIYKAFKNYYESEAHFQTLGDREKQRIYEGNAFLWSIVFIRVLTASEKNDEASKRIAKEAAETVFNDILEIPIKSVHLKPNGMKMD